MFDKNKIDAFFNQSAFAKKSRRTLSEKLRIILPSIAALLLGLLILFPTIKEDVSSIAFELTKPQKGELEKLMVENLNFYITDASNIVHNIKSTHIEEIDTEKKITKLDNVAAIYNNTSSDWIDVKSNIGYFYQNQNILNMPNIVDIFYTQGFEMTTSDVSLNFNENKIYSKTNVFGDGFLGKVEADSFEINTKTEVITFIGNVKIIKSEEQ